MLLLFKILNPKVPEGKEPVAPWSAQGKGGVSVTCGEPYVKQVRVQSWQVAVSAHRVRWRNAHLMLSWLLPWPSYLPSLLRIPLTPFTDFGRPEYNL